MQRRVIGGFLSCYLISAQLAQADQITAERVLPHQAESQTLSAPLNPTKIKPQKASRASQEQNQAGYIASPIPPHLTYLDVDNLQRLSQAFNKGYLAPLILQTVISDADAALEHIPDPVTNKPKPAESGNFNDYLSLAPYFWPDPKVEGGKPWIRKDGEVNPKTRGIHTDKLRLSVFLLMLERLSLGFLHSGDVQYLTKAKELIYIWLLDPKTRMNPNLNYGQGVPGITNGRPFGIIEFEKVSNVITTLELLKHHQLVDKEYISRVDGWLVDYLEWLINSDLGKQAASRPNNHSNWYDFQVMGLMLYLQQYDRAKQYAKVLGQTRIDPQILPSGQQPHELKRTKSVSYTSMNLLAFIENTHLARQVGVDLWSHKGPTGESIKAALDYFIPFVDGNAQWTFQQIGGGPVKAFQRKAMPMLHVAHTVMGNEAISAYKISRYFSYLQPRTIARYGLSEELAKVLEENHCDEINRQ